MDSNNPHITKNTAPKGDDKYASTLSWLYSQLPMFSRIGAAAYKPGLDNTLALDEIFGHPHKKFRSIHVGGTNGKGSVSHTLAAVLQANGYKVGLYTSPHLVDFRERIKVNGEMIPREAVLEFVEKWQSVSTDLRPSFFELTMMMAFDWFAREHVEYAVIEVGMGGRLDSTNIITPIHSVITNISKDHTQFLGDTLTKIASEKAGIIKPGIPIVVGEVTPETRGVFLEKANSECISAPIVFAEEQALVIHAFPSSEGGLEVDSRHIGKFHFPLGGTYQIKNINTTLSVIHSLEERDLVKLDTEKTLYGLEHVTGITGLKGRWQIAGREPLVICDTGHNYAGLSSTISQLEYLRSAGKERYRRTLRFVIGFVNDKDVKHIVSLFPKDAEYYFTQANVPRAMPAEKVAEIFTAHGIKGHVYPKVIDAYSEAIAEASTSDIIYVGGSTFIVADFLAGIASPE